MSFWKTLDHIIERAVLHCLSQREQLILRLTVIIVVAISMISSFFYPTLASQFLFVQLAMVTFFYGLKKGKLWFLPTWVVYCLCVAGPVERSLFALFCLYALLITGVTVHKFRQARNQQLQLEWALSLARQVQESLQPPPLVDLGYAQLASHIEMATELSGDFVCYQACKSGHLILIGDVMGKGAQAALTAAYVKGLFDELASHLDDPRLVLLAVHQRLIERTGVDSFLAATCVLLDKNQGYWKICRAGLPAAGIVRRDGSHICAGEAGITLGIPVTPQLKTLAVRQVAGDQFFQASDGFCEEEDLPLQVVRVLSTSYSRPVTQALQQCLSTMHQDLSVGAEDDKTAVLIRWS